MIRIEHLSKRYDEGGRQVTALYDINLTIAAGEFVAVLGPRGSGKSTLLLTLGGLIQPSEGTYYLNDQSVYDLNVTKRALLRQHVLGFMYQTFNLIPYLTALDNVRVGLCVTGQSDKAQLNRAEALLQRVGLQDRMDHKPGELSVGERQRVALVRALANEPAMILADEPTSNLDPWSSAQVFEALEQLNQEGVTIVMATHSYHAAELAQRQIRIVAGHMIDDEESVVVGMDSDEPHIYS